MVRKRGEHGVVFITAAFFIAFTLISMNYFRIAFIQEQVGLAEERSELKIVAGTSQGTIYDRNMTPMINCSKTYSAVAVPAALSREETAKFALDKEEFYNKFDKGKPFVFSCGKETPESAGLTVFSMPQRYSENMPAQHIIGYLSDGKGVSGLEYAYDQVFRGESGENSVTYSVDGFGHVLIGDGKEVIRSSAVKTGVVTTIDIDIQRICEEASKEAGKGAIVVSEVNTGDILALASFPGYSVNDLESAISDENSPMINRALYSYGVGSIFKLVTACEGIRENFGGYMYRCDGCIDINGVKFRCHMLDGHEIQNMSEAIANSCNTYFISLSRNLSVSRFRSLAYELGFGKETFLCAGMTGSAGVLPAMKDLMLPAEMANFSFGQGKLTATPLQISALTCAVANGGELPELRLIKGMTVDGKQSANEKPPRLSRTIDESISNELRNMMVAAVRDNENSNARTFYTTVGAKTSTAQTGRFDEEGNEFCHAWITGFFPTDKPEYAVTVLVEDGGYGNDAAAPIFREIVDKIAIMKNFSQKTPV
ncbi:MAG TPA: penicillin-binding protein 2 [Ruminococcus sp.]|mgnify:CR=1 FL=1